MTMATKDKNRPAPGQPAVISGGCLLALAVVSALALFLAYLPGERMSFFYDDIVTILHNPDIQSRSLADALRENPFRAVPNLTFNLQIRSHQSRTLPPRSYDLAAAAPYIRSKFFPELDRNLAVYTDPLTREEIPVSIDAANRAFFPLPPATPFRRLNLFIHFGNAVLLFMIMERLKPGRRGLALAAALAFMFHPLATEPVNYITARMGLLCVTFSLAAVLARLYADENKQAMAWAAVCFVLALFSKENAAVLPLIIFILDAARGRPRLWVLAGLLLSAAYAILRLYAWPVIPQGSGGEPLSTVRYLLIEQRVVLLYLAKIFFPLHLNFDPRVVPALGLDALCAIINAALLIGSAYIIARAALSGLRAAGTDPPARENRQPSPIVPAGLALPAAVILMAWVSLAPASSLIPLSDLAKEERAYPLLVIVIPAVFLGLLSAIFAARPRARTVAAASLAVIMLCLAALTLDRNLDWETELTLTRDMVGKSPEKPRALHQYATALKLSGRLARALFWYERAVALDPTNADALNNIEALKEELKRQKQGG
jgi:hypothetical protein